MTILYLIAAVLLAAPPEEPKFTGGAERLRVYFNDLFDASKKVNAPKEKEVARGKIEAALDWDRIALESKLWLPVFWQFARFYRWNNHLQLLVK